MYMYMIGVCGSPVAHRLELRMIQLSVSPAMLEYTTSITPGFYPLWTTGGPQTVVRDKSRQCGIGL